MFTFPDIKSKVSDKSFPTMPNIHEKKFGITQPTTTHPPIDQPTTPVIFRRPQNSSGDLVMKFSDQNETIPFKIYSGYLTIFSVRHLHYLFTESVQNAKDDPLILRINSPGCSGLSSFFTDIGPYMVKKNNSELTLNPFSWNKMANMLYIEAHENLGFSFTEGKNLSTNDDTIVENLLNALKEFYGIFPHLRTNDLYLSGRGHAFIYISSISIQLLNETSIPFKGLIMENGCFDDEKSENSKPFFIHQKGILNKTSVAPLAEKCCGGDLNNLKMCEASSQKDLLCKEELKKINQRISNSRVNTFNIHYKCEMPDIGMRGDFKLS